MTVPILDLVTQYTGTGSRTFFEFGFEPTDGVRVLVNGLPVAFVLQATGVVITPAPALNATILIYRETDVTQLRDFQPFESFDADKTESAVDKLIYLKQEALIYRAQLNLYANPFVDRVELVNDKGSDAVIYLWNAERAGMFAGQLGNIPNAGTEVDKPESFAYFQCGGAIPLAQIWTTTPYPIEVIDELQLTCDIVDEGFMQPIPGDERDFSASLLGAELLEILLSAPPVEEERDFAASLLGAELLTILLSAPPIEEERDFSASLLGVELLSLLVTVDTPDEKLQLAMDVVPEGCSMTAV